MDNDDIFVTVCIAHLEKGEVWHLEKHLAVKCFIDFNVDYVLNSKYFGFVGRTRNIFINV